MKISILIPVYNGALLITRCLDSVLTQKGHHDLEIICIDDGSTDNSVEIIKKYPYPIKLIQQSNQGPASARNKGLEVAAGKYLAFLDADDYWAPDFLMETVSFLEKFSEAIAVSVGQKHITPGNSGRIVPAVLESEGHAFREPIVLEDFFSFWAEHFHICTGSILMKTKIIKNTGGQRTELRITEDLEFWARLATLGPIGFIPKVLFISDGGRVTKKIGWLEKNRKRWASAPTVEQWEEQIILTLDEKDKKSFSKARGRIAKNLCYSMLMSNRTQLARKECIKYREDFPNDKVARGLKIGSRNRLFWFIVVKIIYSREYLRNIRLK